MNIIEPGLIGSLIGPSMEDHKAMKRVLRLAGFEQTCSVLAGMDGGLYYSHPDGRHIRVAPLPNQAGSVIERAE